MIRIGLLVDLLTHPYQTELLLGAHGESERAGVSLYCLAGGEINAHQQRNSIYSLIGPHDMDGFIVSSGTMSRNPTTAELSSFLRRFAPTPLTSISIPLASVPSVVIDNVSGIRELTSHLIESHGRRRIAFVQVANPEGKLRFDGYRLALEEHGLALDPDLLVPGAFTADAGAHAVEVLFDQRQTACDAIVGASDWIAIGALEALRSRGIRVPEQVAITGFDDVDEARFSLPAITTIHQRVRQLGATALQLTLAQVRGESVPLVTTIATQTEYRQSCGCVKLGARSRPLGLSLSPAASTPPPLDRRALQAAMLEVAPDTRGALPDEWPLRLIEAVVHDLEHPDEEQFPRAMLSLLEQVRHLKEVHRWHRVVTVLRVHTARHFQANHAISRQAESLYEQAHLVVAAEAERLQGKLRWDREHLMNVLNELSAELRSAFDYAAATRILTHHLARLEVPSCYVALQSREPSPDSESRLIMAHDSSDPTRFGGGERPFRSGDLIPPDARPARRHTMIMEPLWCDDSAQGFCILEMGAPTGLVYETIREQLSSAFHAALLLQAKVEETTKREKLERERLEEEMRLAARIQTSMLPRARKLRAYEIAAEMQPATQVGGDYFDILPFEGGFWLGIGDVAGHGLDTGLMMLMIQGIVAGATCQHPEVSPGSVYRTVNTVLYENVRERLERDDHATLMLLRYHDDGRVLYAGAHEDLLIFRSEHGSCEVWPSSGLWVAILPELEPDQVDENELLLNPGDLLLAHTDGITEAMKGTERFGIERLKEAFTSVGRKPIEAIRAHIFELAQRWSPELTDDRTLVVVRYLGTPQRPRHFTSE